MRPVIYLLYSLVVVGVCTFIDAGAMRRASSAPRYWSSGSTHGIGSTGGGGWSGGAHHK